MCMRMTWNWSETTPHAIHMANPCTERAGSEHLKFELCPNINSNSWDLHGFTQNLFSHRRKKHHVVGSSWVYDSSVMDLHVSSPTKKIGKKRNNAPPPKKYIYIDGFTQIYFITEEKHHVV